MHKKLLLILVSLLAFSTLQTPAAAQAQTPSFTVQTITIKNQPAYDMKVSPDGRIAAVYAGTTTLIFLGEPASEYTVDPRLLPIRLIDLTTGSEIGQLTGQTDYASDLAFTPDGKELASYHANGEIYLWDIATLKPVKRLTAVIGRARIKFMPDGKTLITYVEGTLGQFLLWNLDTGNVTAVWHVLVKSFGDIKFTTMPGRFDYTYTAFDISPDGTRMATATPNGEVALWDTTTLQQTVIQPKTDKPALLNIRALTFSADGKRLVYYDSETNQTDVWDLAAQKETTLPVGSTYFALSPHNDALAWATRQEIWFAKLDQPNLATKVLDIPINLVSAQPTTAFSPDGSRLIVGGFYNRDNSGNNLIYIITLT